MPSRRRATPALPPVALSYARVSTKRQAGETRTSIADQEAATSALAAQLSAPIIAWFRDDESGTTADRDDFTRLRAYCAQHRRDAASPGYVLCLDDSRFGRFDDVDEHAAIRVELRKLGWVVRFAVGDETQDPTIRPVMRAIHAAQASQYSRALGEKVRKGKRGAALQGYWTTTAPLGYRRQVVYPALGRVLETGQGKGPEEKVRLTPGPEEERAIVRFAFEAYGSGALSLFGVVRALQARYPRVAGAARTWSEAGVRWILCNPAYVGDTVAGRGREHETTIRDTHEGLVSRELFDAVQARFAEQPRDHEGPRHDYRVSGLIACVHCGTHYTALGTRDKKYRYYGDRGVRLGKCPVPGGTVAKDLLEQTVIDTLAGELTGPAVRAALERAAARLLSADAPSAARLEALSRERRAVQAKHERTVSNLTDGTITADEARLPLAQGRARLKELDQEIAALAVEVPSPAAIEERQRRLVAIAQRFRDVAATLSGPELRQAIRPWIHALTFDKRTRTLTMALRAPTALLLSNGRSGTPWWRRCSR